MQQLGGFSILDLSRQKNEVPFGCSTEHWITGDSDEAMAGKKALALYFSAHWCPPCRGFTPQLAQWYEKDRDFVDAGDTFEEVHTENLDI